MIQRTALTVMIMSSQMFKHCYSLNFEKIDQRMCTELDLYISVSISVSLAQPSLPHSPNLGLLPILSKISISAESRLLLHSLICVSVYLGKDKLTKTKNWISQQALIGSSSNFELKLRGPNQNKKCLKWRWPLMEDDL